MMLETWLRTRAGSQPLSWWANRRRPAEKARRRDRRTGAVARHRPQDPRRGHDPQGGCRAIEKLVDVRGRRATRIRRWGAPAPRGRGSLLRPRRRTRPARLRTTHQDQRRGRASGLVQVRGGPGSVMFVPPGCPHAFANLGPVPVRMLFLVAPPGHEHYLEEIAELLAHPEPPDPAAIARVRARHDIQQLTPMVPRRPLR